MLLDFVPNHVAPDHPWASEHTRTTFFAGPPRTQDRTLASYIEVGGSFYACGRDP